MLGLGGIPTSGVSAVALNVGAHVTSTDCWVQVQPAAALTPPTRLLIPASTPTRTTRHRDSRSWRRTRAANITFSTNCASTDVYVDVEGYYVVPTDGSSGDVYVPITKPGRVVDTRHNVGVTGKMTAGRVVRGTQAVPVVGVAGVPSDGRRGRAESRHDQRHADGSNTVWTDGTARPTRTSSVDVDPNVIESNLVFLETGANGKIDIADQHRRERQSNDLYIDVEGYFYRPAIGTRVRHAAVLPDGRR